MDSQSHGDNLPNLKSCGTRNDARKETTLLPLLSLPSHYLLHCLLFTFFQKEKREQLHCSKKSTATIKKKKVRIRRSPPSQPSEEEAESAYPPLHFRGKPHKATT
ncbi:hypothetical protein PIB30_039113, partial [Stylosanthes scabra]|nr:hypothetical protein [Stylosanthes scabra]